MKTSERALDTAGTAAMLEHGILPGEILIEEHHGLLYHYEMVRFSTKGTFGKGRLLFAVPTQEASDALISRLSKRPLVED